MSKRIRSSNPDAKIHNIPVSMDYKMKTDIDRKAKELSISAQGVIRMSVKFFLKNGAKIPGDLIAEA
jgi:hypothetical protein